MFFFLTMGDDGSRQYPSYAAILAAVLRFFSYKWMLLENFSYKSSIVFTPNEKEEVNRFSLHFPFGSQLHKETTYFLSTIGDDGSRQYPSVAAILAAVLRFFSYKWILLENFSHKSSIVFTPNEKEEVNRFSLHFPFGSLYHHLRHHHHLHQEKHVMFAFHGGDIARSK